MPQLSKLSSILIVISWLILVLTCKRELGLIRRPMQLNIMRQLGYLLALNLSTAASKSNKFAQRPCVDNTAMSDSLQHIHPQMTCDKLLDNWMTDLSASADVTGKVIAIPINLFSSKSRIIFFSLVFRSIILVICRTSRVKSSSFYL